MNVPGVVFPVINYYLIVMKVKLTDVMKKFGFDGFETNLFFACDFNAGSRPDIVLVTMEFTSPFYLPSLKITPRSLRERHTAPRLVTNDRTSPRESKINL